MWQLPVPVSITGTEEFSTTDLISPAPPLGISRSRRPLALIICVAESLLVSVTRLMQSSGNPASAREFLMELAMAILEFMASFPPRSTTALPALRHIAAASAVTLGRASYIMPMTPMGTDTFFILRPLGRSNRSRVFPTGSSMRVISIIPSDIAQMRSSLSIRRSRSPLERPFFFPFSRSTALAARILSSSSISPFAI